MDATDADMKTILQSEFRALAVDPAQPDQWAIAGEFACLRAMRRAYELGRSDQSIVSHLEATP